MLAAGPAARAGASLDRCPACRGRLTAEPTCPRCGCDLMLVRRAQAQAQQRLVQGLRAFALGDADQARAQLQASQRLAASPLAAQMLRLLAQLRLSRPA